ncbi:MAG: phosphoribosyltransferase family protein [Acidobacteriota bacterium]
MMNDPQIIPQTFSAGEIADRVAVLARDIRADAGDAEILLVGVLKGASVFLADLLRAIPGPVRYHFVDVIYSERSLEQITDIFFVTHFPIEGQHIYLLKDVVSTGITENYLLSHLRLRNPALLKLVALLDRPADRRLHLNVDYSLFEVNKGIFVGYGLDHDGNHENLPYLGALSPL